MERWEITLYVCCLLILNLHCETFILRWMSETWRPIHYTWEAFGNLSSSCSRAAGAANECLPTLRQSGMMVSLVSKRIANCLHYPKDVRSISIQKGPRTPFGISGFWIDKNCTLYSSRLSRHQNLESPDLDQIQHLPKSPCSRRPKVVMFCTVIEVKEYFISKDRVYIYKYSVGIMNRYKNAGSRQIEFLSIIRCFFGWSCSYKQKTSVVYCSLHRKVPLPNHGE